MSIKDYALELGVSSEVKLKKNYAIGLSIILELIVLLLCLIDAE